MTDSEIFELIKKCLPENVSYSQDGGFHNKCKIEGELGDIFKFTLAIHKNGYNKGYDDGWESSKVSTEMNTWSYDDD
jgi:hypothetical protein